MYYDYDKYYNDAHFDDTNISSIRDMADRAGMLILNTCEELDDLSADLMELRLKYIGIMDSFSDVQLARKWRNAHPYVIIDRCKYAEQICDILDEAYSKAVSILRQID